MPLIDLQRVGDDLQRLGVVEVLGAQLDGADAERASRVTQATLSTTG